MPKPPKMLQKAKRETKANKQPFPQKNKKQRQSTVKKLRVPVSLCSKKTVTNGF